MGPVNLSVSACATGSPGCSASSNTGNIYAVIENSSIDGQALLALRLPDGAVPAEKLTASLGGGGSLEFLPNSSYTAQLQELEPAPEGERWWGWVSSKFAYSQSSKQSFSVTVATSLPPSADGGPLPSPMHWRPVVGTRVVSGGLTAGRPVDCGDNLEDLYEGHSENNEAGNTIVCIDSPDEAGTRGYIGATITDFGIVGTAVQAPAGSTVTATFLAKRTGPADAGTSFALSATGGPPGGSVAIDTTAVSLGGDSTKPVLATIEIPAGTAAGGYPVTLTATAAGKPTRVGTATVTVPPAPPLPAGKLTLNASLTKSRFRSAKLKLRLSDSAAVKIVISRKKKKGFKQVGVFRRALPAGLTKLPIGRKLGSVRLTPGRHRLVITATGSGLSSTAKTLGFTLLAKK